MELTLPAEYPTNPLIAFEMLAAKERLTTSDLTALALIEASGKSLYGHMAKLSGNRQISDLLNRNGQEEVGHAHRILKAVAILTGNHYELPEEDGNPMVGDCPFDELSAQVLENFIEGELAGEGHYNRWADNEPDEKVAKLLRQNASEERRHAERDRKALSLLKN